MDESQPVRLRMLGAALRRYRLERGFSLDDAAAMLGCDRSKISRIETGMRGIRSHDLRDLLAEYGVSDSERDGLMALARPHGTDGWQEDYADVLPRAAREYLWLEAAASKVFVYEGQRVPALLRAEGYARAIAEHDPLVPGGTAGKVADAMVARQRAVLGAEQPELVMVIGEAALRQQVGGAKVMRAQLDRLAALSMDSDRVTILVLPFASGAHAGAGSGPVTIFGFGQAPGLGAVHQAGLSGGIFLDSHRDLDACTVAFTRLRASALSTEDSARLLCRMAGR
jgi:transcriptional regulator with XRE-family HTH domain